MSTKRLIAAIVSVGAAVLAQPALAASYCNAGVGDGDITKNATTDGQSTSDMTYTPGAPVVAAAAKDCYGVASGNDDATAINALNWGTGWALAARDNTNSSSDISNTVANVAWTLTDMGNVTQGTWELSGTGAGVPGTFDFVGVLKGSNGFAAYFFDDVYFDGLGGGGFKMSITNNGGQIAGLSHMTIYARAGTCQTNCGGGGGGGTAPEPASLALMATALLGLGAIRRRRR